MYMSHRGGGRAISETPDWYSHQCAIPGMCIICGHMTVMHKNYWMNCTHQNYKNMLSKGLGGKYSNSETKSQGGLFSSHQIQSCGRDIAHSRA